jgi:hypothetical protein
MCGCANVGCADFKFADGRNGSLLLLSEPEFLEFIELTELLV